MSAIAKATRTQSNMVLGNGQWDPQSTAKLAFTQPPKERPIAHGPERHTYYATNFFLGGHKTEFQSTAAMTFAPPHGGPVDAKSRSAINKFSMREASFVLGGAAPEYMSTAEAAFDRKDSNSAAIRQEVKAATKELQKSHFELGAAPPTLASEARASYRGGRVSESERKTIVEDIKTRTEMLKASNMARPTHTFSSETSGAMPDPRSFGGNPYNRDRHDIEEAISRMKETHVNLGPDAVLYQTQTMAATGETEKHLKQPLRFAKRNRAGKH